MTVNYSTAAGALTFAPGQTIRTSPVLVTGDRTAEPNETFAVNLTGPTNAGVADGQGLGVIVDDDPYVSVRGAAVADRNAGTTDLTFTVTLSTTSDLPVTVDYATGDGSVVAGEDYAAASGTVIFTPGESVQTVTVPVNGDPGTEYDESLYVTLTYPAGAAIDVGRASGTIRDDDGVAVSVGDVSDSEPYNGSGYSNWFGFTVTLSAPSDETVTVDFYTVDGSATSYADYIPTGGR